MSLVAAPTPVTPGEASPVVVTITNDGALATSFVLRVVGLADEWVDPPAATPVLGRGESAEVAFVVRLPHGFPVSRQLVGVVAEPLAGDAEPERCQLDLLVGELDGVVVEVRPLEVRGGDKGRFSVHLDNRHPLPAELSLEGLAPERRVKVSFDQDHVVLPGGSSVVVRGRLRGGRPFAGRGRRLPFAVRVGGAAEPVHVEGGFTQTPVLSSNVLKVVAVIAVLGLWIGALGLGLDRLKGNDADDLADAQAAAQQQAEDDQAGADGGAAADGQGADGTGADGGAAGDGEASADDAAEAATGIKVGGTVEAADPGGVTVRVEPVQGSDEDAAKAALVDVPDSTTRGKRVGGVPRGLDEVRTTSTDDTGQWAFEGLRSPAYYLITFSKAGYAPRSFVVQATDGEPIALDVILEAGNGSVSGVVVDEDGRPIGGADVTVTDGDVVLGVRTASTGDGIGQFTVDGLATPGSFLVTAARDGYGTESTDVDLGGSGSEGGIVLQMTAGVGALSGTVIGVDGPLGNATVTVSNDDGSVVRSATTLTEAPVGTYRLPGLPIPGNYLLTIEASGYSTSTQRVDVDGSEVVDVELQEITGRVTGVVTVDALDDSDDFEDGDPLSGVGVTLTADGVGFKTTTVDAPVPGSFDLDGVPAGTYVAAFQRFGFQTSTVLVTIGPGQEVVVDGVIAERPPAEIDATGEIRAVLNTTGTLPDPAGTATIVNAPPRSTFATTATIDATSRSFAFTALPPGVYRIRIDAQRHEVSTITVNVPSGQVVNITPQIIPWGSASGVVLSTPGGTALAGATVTLASTTSSNVPAPVVTGADGTWSFQQELPAADYTLTVTHPDHVPAAPLPFTISPGETEPAITTELVARQVLNVTVTDVRTAQPLDGARVRLYEGNLTGDEPPSGAVAQCGSIGACDLTVPVDSPNGTVTFRGLLNGTTYTGYATLTDRRTARFTIIAQDRRTDTRLLPLASTTGSGVTGVVQFQFDNDPTRPVEGATVTVSGTYRTDPTTGADITETRQTTTNASGGFTLTYANLPIRGNATVTVTHPNFDVPAGTQPIVFDSSDPTPDDPDDAITPTVLNPVRLTPKDNQVSGSIVLSPAPVTATTPTVTILSKPPYAGDVTGVVTLAQFPNRFTVRLRDAAASTPTVPEVRPGTYQFRVTASDYSSSDVTVCVPVPGSPANPSCPGTFPEVTLSGNGSVIAQVSTVIPDDTSGATRTAPDGTLVVMLDGSGAEVGRDTTVGGVTDSLPRRPAGSAYTIVASLTRHRAASSSGTIVAGENTVVPLQMQSLGAIDGTVTAADNGVGVALSDAVTVRGSLGGATCTSVATQSESCFLDSTNVGGSYLLEGGATAPFGLVNGTWTVSSLTPITGFSSPPPGTCTIDVTNRTCTADLAYEGLDGSITGTVTVTGNAPIAGIHVVATPQAGGGTPLVADTNADGVYTIPDVPSGTYDVRFSSDTVRAVTVDDVFVSRGLARRLDQQLVSLTTTINVLARATYGSSTTPVPLEGATVRLFTSGTSTQVQTDRTTGADGRTTFELLGGGGGIRVEVTPPTGYSTPASQTVTADGGFRDLTFDVRSVDRPTSVRIVSQAAPSDGIPNIPVTFTPTAASPGRPTVSNVITGSTGLANATLPHGTYTVSIGTAATPAPPAPPPPLHATTLVSSGLVVAATNTPDPLSGLDYQIAEARIVGTVAVQGGTPTAIRVRLLPGTNPDGTTVRETRILSAPGDFEWFVPANTQFVTVGDVEGDPSYLRANQVITSTGNGTTTPVPRFTITIRKTGDASIRVTSGGQPVPGVAVTLNGVTLDTGANGLATFIGVPPGNYTVTAVEPGYANGSTTISVTAGQAAGDVLTPNGSITISGDRAHRVVVRDSTGARLNGAAVTIDSTTVVTSGGGPNAGVADFTGLAPGTHTLGVVAAGHEPVVGQTITVTATQVRDDTGNTKIQLVALVVVP